MRRSLMPWKKSFLLPLASHVLSTIATSVPIASCSVNQPQLFTNPSFEDGTLNGWIISDYANAAVIQAGSSGSMFSTAADGEYYIQSHSSLPRGPSTIFLRQTLTGLDTTMTYTISFSIAGNPNGVAQSNQCETYIFKDAQSNDGVLGQIMTVLSASGQSWETYSIEFQPTATTHLILFEVMCMTRGYYVGLDNFQFLQPTTSMCSTSYSTIPMSSSAASSAIVSTLSATPTPSSPSVHSMISSGPYTASTKPSTSPPILSSSSSVTIRAGSATFSLLSSPVQSFVSSASYAPSTRSSISSHTQSSFIIASTPSHGASSETSTSTLPIPFKSSTKALTSTVPRSRHACKPSKFTSIAISVPYTTPVRAESSSVSLDGVPGIPSPSSTLAVSPEQLSSSLAPSGSPLISLTIPTTVASSLTTQCPGTQATEPSSIESLQSSTSIQSSVTILPSASTKATDSSATLTTSPHSGSDIDQNQDGSGYGSSGSIALTSGTPQPAQSDGHVAGTSAVTKTLYTTRYSTIYKCPATVTDCPMTEKTAHTTSDVLATGTTVYIQTGAQTITADSSAVVSTDSVRYGSNQSVTEASYATMTAFTQTQETGVATKSVETSHVEENLALTLSATSIAVETVSASYDADKSMTLAISSQETSSKEALEATYTSHTVITVSANPATLTVIQSSLQSALPSGSSELKSVADPMTTFESSVPPQYATSSFKATSVASSSYPGVASTSSPGAMFTGSSNSQVSQRSTSLMFIWGLFAVPFIL
ncbi:hypothetical protein N7523_002699 [Penicillium sp. IBT 18751x]|nr:hypothetical protein N7523_002699 [Penicillium sp. IBT 18751x]